MKKITLTIIALSVSLVHADFEIKELEGKHIDVLDGGKVVARVMTAHDKTTAESGMQFYDPAVKMQGRTRLPLKADNSGIIRQYKSGGRVKGCGIAKRGLGRAMKKGKR